MEGEGRLRQRHKWWPGTGNDDSALSADDNRNFGDKRYKMAEESGDQGRVQYKFILRRDVSNLQFLGSFLIVGSIVMAKLGDLLSSSGGNVIPMMAIVFAVVSSFNSVGVSVYQEQLFKNSGENFLDQQFWLYLYGMLVASLVHIVSSPDFSPL